MTAICSSFFKSASSPSILILAAFSSCSLDSSERTRVDVTEHVVAVHWELPALLSAVLLDAFDSLLAVRDAERSPCAEARREIQLAPARGDGRHYLRHARRGNANAGCLGGGFICVCVCVCCVCKGGANRRGQHEPTAGQNGVSEWPQRRAGGARRRIGGKAHRREGASVGRVQAAARRRGRADQDRIRSSRRGNSGDRGGAHLVPRERSAVVKPDQLLLLYHLPAGGLWSAGVTGGRAPASPGRAGAPAVSRTRNFGRRWPSKLRLLAVSAAAAAAAATASSTDATAAAVAATAAVNSAAAVAANFAASFGALVHPLGIAGAVLAGCSVRCCGHQPWDQVGPQVAFFNLQIFMKFLDPTR